MIVKQTKNNQETIKRVRNPIALPLSILCLCLHTGIGFPLFSQELYSPFTDTNLVKNLPETRESESSGTLTYLKDSLKNDDRTGNQGILTDRSNQIDSLHGQSPVSQQREANEIKIKLTENRLTIENLEKDALLEVYNIMGTKVYDRRMKAGTSTHTLSLPKGYYIIKIGKFSRKIAVR